MDAELDEARRAEPAWDALREQRVLARVKEVREARARARPVRRRALAAGGVLAVAGMIALAWIAPGETPAPEDRRALAPAEPEGGRLTLADGSEVELGADAHVEVVAQSAREVMIAQSAGEVRYRVSHRPERAFVVSAADVEIRVRGTRFVVRVGEDAVEVDVEEGRVEVTRAGASSMLIAGDALRVSAGELASAAPDEPAAPAVARADERAEEPIIERTQPMPRARATPSAPREPTPPAPSMEALLAEADLARRAGRLDEAARALRAAIIAHGGDPRVSTALFSLARVERRRGRDAAAAQAFERAYAADPDAVLAEDALAEAAVSWAACGRADRAHADAARYLERFPSGEYVGRVRALVE